MENNSQETTDKMLSDAMHDILLKKLSARMEEVVAYIVRKEWSTSRPLAQEELRENLRIAYAQGYSHGTADTFLQKNKRAAG